MPKKRYQSFFWTPLPLAKIPGSAHDTTRKPTVLDAHAHLCLLASEEEKVNLGFCDDVAEQFYIANWLIFMQTHKRETAHGRITEGGGRQGVRTPPKISPKIGFLSILVWFPFNHKTTKSAFHVGSSISETPI